MSTLQVNRIVPLTGDSVYIQGAVIDSASFALTASYVLNAVSASRATSALNASTASYVLNAVSASRATSAADADTATSASRATSAANADTASYVLNAVSASYTVSASHANTANNAVYAESAASAANTPFASSASRATSAANADTASYVLNAVSASYAATASHADRAVLASSAFNAASASVATNAINADNATSASYALSTSLAPDYLPLAGGTLTGTLVITGSSSLLATDRIFSGAGSTGLQNASITLDNRDEAEGPLGAMVLYTDDSPIIIIAGASSQPVQITGSLNVGYGITGSLFGTASNSNLLNGLASSVFATTASNTFTGTQYISNSTNATTFTSTAALYTDGGMRVTKDAFISGGLSIAGNLTVFGTSSVNFITSSTLVGLEFINLNTDLPALRYAGINVGDSGSSAGVSSSFWYDSQNNDWIFVHAPAGSSQTTSSLAIFGPAVYNSVGNEVGITGNYLAKGQVVAGADHDHHITSSQIYDDGTTVAIAGNLQVTGSLSADNLTGSLNGSNLVNASVANAKLANSSVTVTAGTGMSGGGSVALGSSVTLTNAGVTSNAAGTGVSVSSATGAVTISIGQAVGTGANVQFNSLGVGTAGSGTTGEIRATADVTAYYSSDERLKENVTPIENPIEKLMAINGVTFDWKEGFDEIHSHKGADTGVIAQQIEAIGLPDVVTTRENGFKAVKYEKLNALLIEGFKVQQTLIHSQQSQIDELKTLVNQLLNK